MRMRHLGSSLGAERPVSSDGIPFFAAIRGAESRAVSIRSLVGSRFFRALAGLAVCACAALVFSCGDAPTGETRSTQEASGGEIVVSAASDMSPVLEELAPLFEEESGVALKTNLGSTGQLTEQISAGAGVDVFLAASTAAIDQLRQQGLLVPGSDRVYARGRLAIWTRTDGPLEVTALQDLADPQVKRFSIANPDHAPYGRAAREALLSLGLWEELQPKIVPAENVRQAFQFAESGNTDVGLVALSLVILAGGSYALVPERLHEPIDQALAIVAASSHQSEAQRFIAFLTGEKGREILSKYGFAFPGEG